MIRRILTALDRHWFEPASLRHLGMVRAIVFASYPILFGVPLAATLRMAGTAGALFEPLPVLKVMLLPLGWGARPPVELLVAAHVVAVVAGIGAVLGLWTRATTLLAAAAHTLLWAHFSSFNDVHHSRALLILATWVIALAPSGAAFSLDALRRRRAGRPPEPDLSMDARWPLRTVQWLFAIVYLSAGLSKLSQGGLDWMNGYTLAYAAMQDGVRWGSELGMALAGMPRLAQWLSIGAVAFELTFAVAILVPRVTWLYVLAGIAMHATIGVVQRVWFLTFIVLYVVFLEALRQYGPLARRRAVSPAPPSAKEPAAAELSPV